MHSTLLLLTLACGVSGPGPESDAGYIFRADDCLISWQREIDVPAQVPGMLHLVNVNEGTRVATGELLAQIDDTKALTARTIADAALQEATERAENDINVRLAKATVDVAEAEYTQALDANRLRANTIQQSQIRHLQLAWQRAKLAEEQAAVEQRLSGYSKEAKTMEFSAAENEIGRHAIHAMGDGMVVEVYRHAGEWVQPGDAVMRIAPMNRLRVETLLRASELGPHEVAGRPVRVVAELERGRTAEFFGEVTYVHAQVHTGEYRIWAEVENRMENGQWLLRPGADASLEIDVTGEANDSATPRGTPSLAEPQQAHPYRNPIRN